MLAKPYRAAMDTRGMRLNAPMCTHSRIHWVAGGTHGCVASSADVDTFMFITFMADVAKSDIDTTATFVAIVPLSPLSLLSPSTPPQS